MANIVFVTNTYFVVNVWTYKHMFVSYRSNTQMPFLAPSKIAKSDELAFTKTPEDI
ncbi:hypothetical protein ALT721_2120044 [Alteromonas alvinellae]